MKQMMMTKFYLGKMICSFKGWKKCNTWHVVLIISQFHDTILSLLKYRDSFILWGLWRFPARIKAAKESALSVSKQQFFEQVFWPSVLNRSSSCKKWNSEYFSFNMSNMIFSDILTNSSKPHIYWVYCHIMQREALNLQI